MEMAPGALPRPGRVPEQRLLSPKIWLRRRRRCGTVLEISLTPLGFSVPRFFIGEGASSEGSQGLHTPGWRGNPHAVRSTPLYSSAVQSPKSHAQPARGVWQVTWTYRATRVWNLMRAGEVRAGKRLRGSRNFRLRCLLILCAMD
jgi:hypothetical protein